MMRNKFVETLVKEKTKNYFFLTGDLGYGALEPLEEALNNKFLNLGITEQAIAGVSAGIASEGSRVFFYSIANFSTFRCAEQIRNDIDYHNLDVTIVSVGGGLSYGSLGYSHHAVQDFSLMRSFVNMMIYAPADPIETELCTKDILESSGPSYLRLGKRGEKNLQGFNEIIIDDDCGFRIRKSSAKLKKKLVISTGTGIQYLDEHENFDTITVFKWGKSLSLISDYIKQYEEIEVLENHYKSGGFFSWILENVDNNARVNLKSINVQKDTYNQVVTEENYFKKFLMGRENY